MLINRQALRGLFLCKKMGVLLERIFTDKAVDEIYKYSAGSARAINKVCTHSLLSAAQRNKKLIDAHMVHMVIDQLP